MEQTDQRKPRAIFLAVPGDMAYFSEKKTNKCKKEHLRAFSRLVIQFGSLIGLFVCYWVIPTQRFPNKSILYIEVLFLIHVKQVEFLYSVWRPCNFYKMKAGNHLLLCDINRSDKHIKFSN